MDWLIRQLFGTHAESSLFDKIRAEIGIYLASNPQASEDAVVAWVTSQADRLVAQALVHFPGWASAVLIPLLNGEVAKLIDAAYKQFAPIALQSAGGQIAA